MNAEHHSEVDRREFLARLGLGAGALSLPALPDLDGARGQVEVQLLRVQLALRELHLLTGEVAHVEPIFVEAL